MKNYRMVIEFNEKEVKRKNYSVNSFFSSINKFFEENNLMVIEDGVYVSGGSQEDEFNFMVAAGVLRKTEWFVKFVKIWLWYEDNEDPQDLIKTFKLKG